MMASHLLGDMLPHWETLILLGNDNVSERYQITLGTPFRLPRTKSARRSPVSGIRARSGSSICRMEEYVRCHSAQLPCTSDLAESPEPRVIQIATARFGRYSDFDSESNSRHQAATGCELQHIDQFPERKRRDSHVRRR
jgi:hypothetical protein